MVWIAKSDTSFPALRGPRHKAVSTMSFTTAPKMRQLDCGSLIIETTVDHAAQTPATLLECTNPSAPNSRFSLSLGSDGNVKTHLQIGDAIHKMDVTGTTAKTHENLRITFSWDVHGNAALLSVEALEQGALCQAETTTPLPMPVEIVDALLAQNGPAHVSANVTFLGVSDQIEPVGFTPSIAKHALVETPSGAMPIENMLCGDLVTTKDSGPQPIRWICERTVPTSGLFQPLRLRAPYFGLTQDILVAPEQRLLFESTEIEYMFGVESVLVEARHLTNNINVIREQVKADNIRLYQLLFDDHQIITVAGCQMESLYIGQIADNPEMLKSTLLSGMPPSDIPYHQEIARPLLRSYEAMALHCGAFH